jgi:hypothetical protein
MMARSTTRSNQRPDTLIQDRICQIDESLLQRTARPYIRVIGAIFGPFAARPLMPQQLRNSRRLSTAAWGHEQTSPPRLPLVSMRKSPFPGMFVSSLRDARLPQPIDNIVDLTTVLRVT